MQKFSFKRVNIFSGEAVDNWILGKFAKKLYEEYKKFGINTTLYAGRIDNVEFNQCLIYLHCDPETASKNDVVMITHIDRQEQLDNLEKLLPKIGLGVCMSKEQMDKLINMGLDKNKLCYVDPAHDGVIPIRKYVIGIASRVYADGRKNESYLERLSEKINPDYFKFRVMGANWDKQLDLLKSRGFEIEYYNNFNYEIYTKKFFCDMDYYLYMGTDEGQMGFIDAQSAGVKTIVTAQGYHLDSNSPITYPFMTYEELEKIFLDIQKEKEDIVSAMKDWTWEKYALKHLMLFEYLKTGKVIENDFKDGINSLIANISSTPEIDIKARNEYIKYLNRPVVNQNAINYYATQPNNCREALFSIKEEFYSSKYIRVVVTLFGIRFSFKKKAG